MTFNIFWRKPSLIRNTFHFLELISDQRLEIPHLILKIIRNWEQIRTVIEGTTWPTTPIDSPEEIEEATSHIITTLQAALINNSHCIKIAPHKKRVLPKHLRELKKEKEALIKRFKRSRHSNLKIQINQIGRLIKSETKQLEEDEQTELLEEINDPETMWCAMRKLGAKEHKITTLYNPQNEAVYTNQDKADLIATTLEARFR